MSNITTVATVNSCMVNVSLQVESYSVATTMNPIGNSKVARGCRYPARLTRGSLAASLLPA